MHAKDYTKNDARSMMFNDAQFKLFEAAEPDPQVASPSNYWLTVAGALGYAQEYLPFAASARMDMPLDDGKPSVAMLVGLHLSFTVQRWAVRLRDNTIQWESAEAWTSRVIGDLHAEHALAYWTKSEVEALVDALLDNADNARFVGAFDMAQALASKAY